jgi:serine/threonine protein phosphatase PrpC
MVNYTDTTFPLFRMVLSHKMRRKGASEEEIERAMYLAALSQFCIYNPLLTSRREWPLRDGDPLHQSAMTKQTCTMIDFHRSLRARDPLGWGFESSDTLLHLIWQLLAWDPKDRMTVSDALKHPYFNTWGHGEKSDPIPGDHNALESQMLDPRMDFNVSDAISEFVCPKCGRVFSDWNSCHTHANSRKHAKFCRYDRSTLPTCLNSHAMLPAHSFSGYCDIQGRRRTIEDFHAIHLLPFQQFYGIFDGHLGNFASKYAASFLYDELSSRLTKVSVDPDVDEWKHQVETYANEAFETVHKKFLEAITRAPRGFMDQSGTTATALLVTESFIAIMSLGDSRAVMSTRLVSSNGSCELSSIQLTKDHVAADKEERLLVESRGGRIIRKNGLDRVMGALIVTRSIGDADLAPLLSRIPHVISMTREQVSKSCGVFRHDESNLCFLILASDGLWDTVSNQEAIDMVAMIVEESIYKNNASSWQESAVLQLAAEALTHEAYVRGSNDNIGVCIVAIN